jgi:hypothetical protein
VPQGEGPHPSNRGCPDQPTGKKGDENNKNSEYIHFFYERLHKALII